MWPHRCLEVCLEETLCGREENFTAESLGCTCCTFSWKTTHHVVGASNSLSHWTGLHIVVHEHVSLHTSIQERRLTFDNVPHKVIYKNNEEFLSRLLQLEFTSYSFKTMYVYKDIKLPPSLSNISSRTSVWWLRSNLPDVYFNLNIYLSK